MEPFQLKDDPPKLLSIEGGILEEKTYNFIEFEMQRNAIVPWRAHLPIKGNNFYHKPK